MEVVYELSLAELFRDTTNDRTIRLAGINPACSRCLDNSRKNRKLAFNHPLLVLAKNNSLPSNSARARRSSAVTQLSCAKKNRTTVPASFDWICSASRNEAGTPGGP